MAGYDYFSGVPRRIWQDQITFASNNL